MRHRTNDGQVLPFGRHHECAVLDAVVADARAGRSQVLVLRGEGGPHNLAWTHPEEVNSALLAFLAT